MTSAQNPEDVARRLIAAFGNADLDGVRDLLADDLRAYVTNAEGGVDEVIGGADYVERVAAMDLPSAQFRLDVTQVVTVRPELVMVMVEVHAARGGRTLHNHAAHLLFMREGKVAEWWMVEALPAESDAFWAS
jgi:ketosteroid isomerase-like protein